MPYLPALLAVRDRILGMPRDHVPRFAPGSDSQGDPIPGTDALRLMLASVSDTSLAARIGSLSVPVWFFGAEGHPWESMFPSITYEFVGMEARKRDWRAHATRDFPLHLPTREVEGSKYPDRKDGPGLLERRPVADPWDFILELVIRTDDPVQSAAVLSYLLRCFPIRGYLRVPRFDGSYRSWYVGHETITDNDSPTMGTEGGTLYEKRLTYRVEGYLDTTDQTFLVPVVRRNITTVNNKTA